MKFSPLSRTPLVLALAAATLSLSACVAPVVVGGAAAGTAVVLTDRRTSGTQLEDQNISFKVERNMSQKFGDTARISANTYGGQVLLTGEAPSQTVKDQATGLAKVENVKSVVNQIVVGPISSFSARSNDTWISSKVRSELLNTKYVPSGSISITTNQGVVYLQGKVTQAEGEYAANAAAGVGGVVKVVKLFEIISRDEAVRLSGSSANNQPPASNATSTQAPIETGGASTGGSNAGDSGVQAIPIK